MRTKLKLFLLLLIFITNNANSQFVYENVNNEIYEYLARMSHKGFIEFDDLIKPVPRETIYNKLNELSKVVTKLSNVEQKELTFYKKEYAQSNSTNENSLTYLKFKAKQPFQFFSAQKDNFYINASPVLQYTRNVYNGKSFSEKAIGAQIWGRIGKHVGFNIFARDVTEDQLNIINDSVINNAQTGYVLLNEKSPQQKYINYSEYKASIGYQWNNGFVSVGQDNLTWGYGVNGKIVLSEKSPFNQYIRLHYRPFSWLKFDYMHIWLNSNLVDSNNSYFYGHDVYGGARLNFVPKYMASHSITITPKKGVDFSIGESIIYTEKLDLGFLFPLMYYKLYDNNKSNYQLMNGNNAQLFSQLSLKNIIPRSHFYATLFVDEIKVSKIFDANSSRNQLGFNVGLQVNDIGLKYLSIYSEYTRVNPFVYNNINPAQNYSSYGFSLGDWVGNNFERKTVGLKYTPISRLKLEVRYQDIKKGPTYSMEEQYIQQPEKKFLETVIYAQTQYYFKASYEVNNNIYILGNYNYTSTRNEYYNLVTKYNNYSLGVKFGL